MTTHARLAHLDRLNDRRRARRAHVKAALCVVLQRAEAEGEWVDLARLAIRFQTSTTTLRAMRAELADVGAIAPVPSNREPVPEDLEARIAAVREAKATKWDRVRKKCLTEAELNEVLP